MTRLRNISIHADLVLNTYRGFGRGFSGTNHHRAMKMVLSATLTRDPAKIEQIKLCFPVLISASVEDKRYQLPEQLRSFRLVLCYTCFLHIGL